MGDLFFSEYIEDRDDNRALELFNNSGATVDLLSAGYVVDIYSDGNTAPNITINLNGTLPPGKTFVLAENDADAIIFNKANQTSTQLSFTGNDAIVLRKGSQILDVIGQVGLNPGTAWTSNDISTENSILRRKPSVTAGQTNPAQLFDPSIQWNAVSDDDPSDLGTHVIIPRSSVKVFTIQGAAHRSPLENQLVSEVPGIVTALQPNTNPSGQPNGGFYLQDPQGDGNAGTSDGIFIFTGETPTVKIGDSVIVTGLVSEIRPNNDPKSLTITQITQSSHTTVSTGNPLPAVTILGTGGRIPPTELIEPQVGNIETSPDLYQPESHAIDFFESMEAMRVQIKDAIAIEPTNSDGEIWVLGDNGSKAPGRSPRGGIVQNSTEPSSYNPERLQIDDTLWKGTNPTLSNPNVNLDAQLGTVEGILDYSDRSYEILNTADLNPESQPIPPSPIVRETTALKSSAEQLTVATFNVSSLDPSSEKLVSRLASIVANNLQAPDIIALQDILDNNGLTDDGTVNADRSYKVLIDAIAAAGGGTYEYQQINPNNNQDGGLRGENSRVGFLYNPSRVTFVTGTAGSANSATTLANNGTLSFNPGRIDPNNSAFTDNPKSLAGLFDFKGQKVLLLNNQFVSKEGDDPQFGPNQPFQFGSEPKRVQQAEVVNTFVQNLLTQNADANVIVLGDFNDLPTSETLRILKGTARDSGAQPLTNLVEAGIAPAERYSAIWEGNSQLLDHILVSQNLLDQAAPEIDIVHVNSEFAEAGSRRDPILARFNFGKNLALSISPTTFSDTASSGTVKGKITRTGDTTNALNVTLTTSDATQANFGGATTRTVTIPAGVSSTEFTLDAVNDNVIDTTWKTVDLTATATGFTDGKTKAVVIDDGTAAGVNPSPAPSPNPIPFSSPASLIPIRPVNFSFGSSGGSSGSSGSDGGSSSEGTGTSVSTALPDPICIPLTVNENLTFSFDFATDNASFGTNSDDTLIGETTDDIIVGRSGDDSLLGAQGNDILDGNFDNDTLMGGKDNDTLLGGGDGDFLAGNSGQDILDGAEGSDSLFGGTEVDTIWGGEGNDTIHGEEGDDSIYGQSGNDSLCGNEGKDTISSGSGQDTIFSGKDNDFVFGGDGDDVAYGDGESDYLSGESGNDSLFGEDANDTLYGGDGTDNLDGGLANDTLVGGTGADSLTGGFGQDMFVYCNLSEGSDIITDFTLGDGGDILNLRPLFKSLGYTGSNPVNNNYLRFVPIGSDTEVQIDPDGPNSPTAFTTLLTLKNVTTNNLNSNNYLF